MTIPNYLATIKRVVRELKVNEKNEINEKSPTLISLNSFISYPAPFRKPIEADRTSKDETVPRALRTNRVREARGHEKNEIDEKRVSAFPYAKAFEQLERRCPDYVDPDRWRQAILDAETFLAKWGLQAEALGWTVRELFGLHPVPAQPAATFCRLSRYDATGLIWLLRGRAAVALTDAAAAIGTPSGGTVTYRKHNKPALGPLGDSLDDISPLTRPSASSRRGDCAP
jgi:hypothetical protein